MAKHRLTEKQIRNAKRREKPYRLFDGSGLALLVSPTGMKSWQLRYRHDGKPQTASLGKLDVVTLAEARDDADKKRRLAAKGEHLTTLKRVAKAAKATAAAQTFKSVATAWATAEARRKKWTPAYVDEVAQSLRNHLGKLDALPISTIQAEAVAPILHAIEISAPAMEERAARRLHAIMDYAVEVGALKQNPLPRRRRAKVERRHYAAITDLPGIGAILRAARDAPDPGKGAQRAHLLLAYTAMRVSEVVGAKWIEFDLDSNVPTWSIPRERMKRKEEDRGPHIVPLPPVLSSALREWRKADGDGATYVCPSPRDPEQPMLPEGIAKHYRNALGLTGKHSPHSWRSAFSTVCREASKDADVIEAQLDHVVGTAVASAYDRAQRLAQRRELLAWYEATLIAARDGAAVVAIDKRKG